jgi:hypothetical protein
MGQEWAATTIVPGPVGEFSVIYNRYLGRWIMLYFDQTTQSIRLRHAPRPTGPWSSPQLVYEGYDIYASYMHPSLVENDGEYVYFTMSRWNPYQVYLMKVQLSNQRLLDVRIVPSVSDTQK